MYSAVPSINVRLCRYRPDEGYRPGEGHPWSPTGNGGPSWIPSLMGCPEASLRTGGWHRAVTNTSCCLCPGAPQNMPLWYSDDVELKARGNSRYKNTLTLLFFLKAGARSPT